MYHRPSSWFICVITGICGSDILPGTSKNEESAFLRTVTTPTVKAEFFANDLSQQGYTTVTIYADKYSGDGTWELAETSVGFPSEASGQMSFNTNASYPQASTVGKWSFTWTWKATKIDGGAITPFTIGTSSHVYYNVLAAPQAPMDTTWVEVLDYACDWAHGETTAVGAASEVTSGIYNDLGDTNGDLTYDTSTEYSMGTDHEEFDLDNFLIDIGTENDVIVNCSDTANLFSIFTRALGIETQTKKRWTYSQYTTNAIDVIGTTSPTWKTFPWGMHHFGWFNSRVYDPCLRVYQSSPILPCDMVQSTYENYLSTDDFDYTGGPYTPELY